ncbi:hypothetical protein DYB37_001909 [Aphanomyces astaci]|uniref:Uncharacterized protein n=1 Tax=Aphanomyces astaci TaxID=112090 RepID=A0A3R7AC07_APHAT|nr:hypothetical protein DYB35_003396 [Aphanomyces astaci]RHZ19735.1 hypothetical protein DYB37_001909 [Aphanomyces astaci]
MSALLASFGPTCPTWQGFDYVVATPADCLPCNVFASTSCLGDHIGFVPFPYSSYAYALDHALFPDGGLDADSADLLVGSTRLPRITVSTQFSADVVVVPPRVFSNVHPPKAFNWNDFNQHRDTIVWNLLQTQAVRPGLYEIELDAWDYVQSSGTCDVCLSITDGYRPQSTSVCPEFAASEDHVGWRKYFASVHQLLADVTAFATTRTNNDICSSPLSVDATCTDTSTLTGVDWFDCPIDDVATATQCLTRPLTACAASKLLANPFADPDVLCNPSEVLGPTQCRRQCSFDYVWREPYVVYGCQDTTSVTQCGSGLDVNRGGDMTDAALSAMVSLATIPSDFQVRVAVDANIQELRQNDQFVKTSGRQVHFRHVGGYERQLQLPIQDIVTVMSTHDPVNNAILPTTEAPVYWRWSIKHITSGDKHHGGDDIVWHDWSANDLVTIVGDDDTTTTVVMAFEANRQHIPVPTSPYSSCDTVPSRATVDISVYDRHGSIVTPTLHATDTVPWRDYALGDRRPSILYSLLHSGSKQQLLPGRYDVHLEAHDGFSTSAVCSTCVTVSDRFRPQSQRGSCPFTGDSSVFQFVGWSAHASDIRAISSHLNAFVTSRQNNDACGDVLDDNNVIACDDVINVTVSDWLNCPVDADYLGLAGVSSSPGNHCVRAALIRNPFVDTTVLADPASFLSPLQCTRTSYVSYQWREVWLDYTCDNAAATAICSSGADIALYRGGDLSDATLDQFQCGGTFSLAATADDLVRLADIQPHPSLGMTTPSYIANDTDWMSLGLYADDSAPHQLHFWSDSTLSLSVTLSHVQAVFTPVVVLANAAQQGNIPLPITNDDDRIVFWRYKVGHQPTWRDWQSNDAIALAGPRTIIQWEAWTNCGSKRVETAATWELHVHLKPTQSSNYSTTQDKNNQPGSSSGATNVWGAMGSRHLVLLGVALACGLM